ncbi:Protein kinase-like domain [Cordyceps militaris CM01]|uniref:Protein kinase-like domain n=1 Tax=Cordyceps militaris (strain CM01) TaxID=983644 RepID=G3JS86_CORMM|nr:Protein kinase-like domain [Cordyceps militaris CM01]EGX88785.1 Protein kinase-like domain [Cordyceps militaris CM01]
MPDELFFVNAPNAQTRRQATADYLAKAKFHEPRPNTDGVVEVLRHIGHPFSDGSIINRETSVQQDHLIRKSIRFGQSDLLAERGNLELIAKETNVPVPRVYDFYTTNEFEHLIMEKMPGVTLEYAWPDLSSQEREDLADQVVQLVSQFRRLQSPSINAALLNRKALRPGLQNSFDFTIERMKKYTWCDAAVHYVQLRCAALHDMPNVFTHADLDWSNIMVLDKKVCGIIDMECSGFFPPYWEWFSVKRMAEGQPDGSWFRLLEARLADDQYAAMWEVERLIQALDHHSEWALTPDERFANRSNGWAEVSCILGVDVGPAPQTSYDPWSKNPWWLNYRPKREDNAGSSTSKPDNTAESRGGFSNPNATLHEPAEVELAGKGALPVST